MLVNYDRGLKMKKSLVTAAIALAVALPLSSFAAGCYNNANCKPTANNLISGYQFDGKSVGMTIPKGPAYYNCRVTNPAKESTDLQIAVNHKILSNRVVGKSTKPQSLKKVLKGGDYLTLTQVAPKLASVMSAGRYVLQCGVQAN